jgi:DNA-binding transcriptional regulator YiaG
MVSLEFSDKLRSIREAFGLNISEMADLLGVSRTSIYNWESLLQEPSSGWERVIEFIVDCQASAKTFLDRRSWIDDGRPWPKRITDLLEKLDWSYDRLAEFLNVNMSTLSSWINSRHSIEGGSLIAIALLELYSDIDPKEWPAALYFSEEDVIAPERVKLLRQGLGLTQRALGNLLHTTQAGVSTWETGSHGIGWCGTLLLRILETFPQSADLFEKIPWGDEYLSAKQATQIRLNLEFSQMGLGRLLRTGPHTIRKYESGEYKATDCGALVYQLLEQYPEEFIRYIQGLSSPSGQACPIW